MIKFHTVSTNSTNESLRIDDAGRFGIGNSAPNASAFIDIASTNRGFLAPGMTSAHRAAI